MVALRRLAAGDEIWLAARHGALYAEHEGFDESFAPLVARIVADFMQSNDPACERAWIAWEKGSRLGSIFCVRQSDEIAKLRLFLLEPAARGKGLGQMLLGECMGFARAAGYKRMELWTHASHKAACALYEKNGFTLMDARAVHSFGVDLIEQSWGITL